MSIPELIKCTGCLSTYDLEKLGENGFCLDCNLKSNQKEDRIVFYFDEQNGISFEKDTQNFYIIYSTKDGMKRDFFLNIDIEFLGVVKQNDKYFIKYLLQEETFIEECNEITKRISHLCSISGKEKKYLIMFLNKFIDNAVKQKLFEEIFDVIYVDKEKNIKYNFSEEINQNSKEILKNLNKAYSITSNQNDFLISFYYSLIAPLAYYIRSKGIDFPYKAVWGIQGSGKTTMQIFFVVRGYDQDITEAKVSFNDIKTIFTFTKSLKRSILPTICDDMKIDFFEKYSAEFKGGSCSKYFGKRGLPTQEVMNYEYKSQPIFTLNNQLNLEVAQDIRMIQNEYKPKHLEKQNIKQWDDVVEKIHPGFLFILGSLIFQDTNFDDLIKEIRNIRTRSDYLQKIITIVEEKIKKLYSDNNIDYIFKNALIETNNNNELEETFIGYLITQWELIQEAETKHSEKEYYNRPNLSRQELDVTNLIKTEGTKTITESIIFLSLSGFKKYVQQNKIEKWRFSTDYINDSRLTPRPEYGVSHRFSSIIDREKYPLKALKIIYNVNINTDDIL